MYTTKGNRRAITRDSATRISSGGGYSTARSRPRPERKREYSRDNNTSWEYGFKSGSSVSNRAPDPSMCVNHTMEFVNLDNYISNMFG